MGRRLSKEEVRLYEANRSDGTVEIPELLETARRERLARAEDRAAGCQPRFVVCGLSVGHPEAQPVQKMGEAEMCVPLRIAGVQSDCLLQQGAGLGVVRPIEAHAVGLAAQNQVIGG